jgi:hypothetical protein
MPQLPELYNFLPEESRLLKEKIISFCDSIQVVKIQTPSQYESAANTAREIAAATKEIETRRTEDKAPHLEKCRLVDDFFNPVKLSLKSLKDKLSAATREWDREQEEIRREQQRKLDEQARKKKEAELRKAEEDRRKAEELRAKAEADAGAGTATEAKADYLEQRAMERDIKAQNITAPVAQVARPAVKGVSTRRQWKGQVTDRNAFVQEMIKMNRPELLMPDASAFNKYASVIKRPWTFPGGKVYLSETSQFRS